MMCIVKLLLFGIYDQRALLQRKTVQRTGLKTKREHQSEIECSPIISLSQLSFYNH